MGIHTPTSCPWRLDQLLDPGFLRDLGAVPHYFGLGFIQIKLDEQWRLHAWVPEWPTIPGAEHELHDHRYDFESTVLQGALVHELWAAGERHDAPQEGDMERILVSCKPSDDGMIAGQDSITGYCAAVPMGRFTVHAGGTYQLSQHAFHRSTPVGDTITLLRRGGKSKELATVLRPRGMQGTCPFSLPVDEAACWDRFESMLKPHGSAFVPGYHLRPITKGVLGETSKIREELDELDEAMEQDVKIMAEVELADLHGALEAYLAKHFPHRTMEDLAAMANVTRRAFLNGRRS